MGLNSPTGESVSRCDGPAVSPQLPIVASSIVSLYFLELTDLFKPAKVGFQCYDRTLSMPYVETNEELIPLLMLLSLAFAAPAASVSPSVQRVSVSLWAPLARIRLSNLLSADHDGRGHAVLSAVPAVGPWRWPRRGRGQHQRRWLQLQLLPAAHCALCG